MRDVRMPLKNTLIGITHTPDGRKIIKEPKLLKVGIGLPRGRAADVYVDQDGKWIVTMGKKNGDDKFVFDVVARVDSREEAEGIFRKAWKAADVINYPRKTTYFKFTRPVMGDDGTEIYVPDFQAIEAHSFVKGGKTGMPTEIDIVFFDDEPFSGSFAMWSSSELRCSGDGENALRSVQMYSQESEVPETYRESWKEAKADGDRTFLISDGCWNCNCPYAKSTMKGNKEQPSACKPSGDLKFQLSRNIRVGGTTFFHTSGYRSITQIFSAVERIKELTGGRIAGIPLKMTLRSHVTNHNNQKAVQQNVGLEFRTEDMDSLRKDLIEQAWKFRSVVGQPSKPVKMIEAGPDAMERFGEDSPMSAQAMANEFYVDEDGDEDTLSSVTNTPDMHKNSSTKVEEISEKLAKVVKAELANTALVETKESKTAEQVEPEEKTSPKTNENGKALWRDRPGMAKAFMKMMGDLGQKEFGQILSEHLGEHKLDMSRVAVDDPKTVACYRAMEKRLTEVKSQPKQDSLEGAAF